MSTHLTYEILQKKYANLLSKRIINVEQPLPTFQAIAGYPNHENVISNYYQFFLKSEHHGIADLFLLALDDCIKDGDITMESYTVEREFTTHLGGRIDLVIQEMNEEETPHKVVIIENKIHHTVENNLKDYWDTFQDVPERFGILLTLKREKEHPNFLNITHKDWIGKIKIRLGNEISSINAKYLVLLQDFITHMESYYKKEFDMESLRFLFAEGAQIDELIKLKANGFQAIAKELSKTITNSEYWDWVNTTSKGVGLKNLDDSLTMYVNFSDIFATKEYSIELWIKGIENINLWITKGYTSEMEALAENNNIELKEIRASKTWGRVGIKSYLINSAEDLYRFSEIAEGRMKMDWNDLAKAIHKSIIG